VWANFDSHDEALPSCYSNDITNARALEVGAHISFSVDQAVTNALRYHLWQFFPLLEDKWVSVASCG